MKMKRAAGILLHPTSLPGAFGIGDLGEEAKRFVDWLVDAGQTVWQVLPLGPTGYGDSPYQCFSAFAGNPLLISIDNLITSGLLTDEDLGIRGLKRHPDGVRYGSVIPAKTKLLRKAFAAFINAGKQEEWEKYHAFCARYASWLNDYALFMALRDQYGTVWNQWEPEDRFRDPQRMEQRHNELSATIEFHRWLQFRFFEDWWEIRHYANSKGISIVGDLPLFVAYDSVDVWANRHLFMLDDELNPTHVAGVPPDYFSETGQRWGNPLYRWDEHRKDGFGWWVSRVETLLDLVDVIRIDHFRGLQAFWQIPVEYPTAENGEWIEAPGADLLAALCARHSELPLVAEDLGVITDQVRALRDQFDLPGMEVLQFAWTNQPENAFLPHHHRANSIVYSGTHDNNTTQGWFETELKKTERKQWERYVGHTIENPVPELIRLAYSSVAKLAIIPLQDHLGLGAECRMNLPGNGNGNWAWRTKISDLTKAKSKEIKEMAIRYHRFEDCVLTE